jgi:GntR family transcriptional regulator, transcriptional repressor for pyruvate dehydrogenase complex
MTMKPRSELSKAKSPEPALPEPPLNRGSVADQVFIKLRDQILQGSLPRGTKLPSERELAQHYRVSAPTIREAIRGLAAVHLVEVRHGTGMYVTAAVDALFAMATSALLEFERVELLDILDILEMLYVKCATLACANASAAEVEGLSAALQKTEASSDVEEAMASLRTFLGLLADAAHNPLISHLCKFLIGLGIELAYEDTRGDFANWLKVGGKLGSDRRKLVEAIKDRDLERATRAATQYHQHTKNLVRDRAATNKRDSTARMQRAFVRMRERGLLS